MANQKFDSSDAAAALKRQWRTRLLAIRKNISPERRKQASIAACEQLISLCRGMSFVLSFASFGTEIDLWPFNESLCKEGRLVLPRCTVHQELELAIVSNFHQLEPNGWGILEPKVNDCPLVQLQAVSSALIPGLGFDLATKHRLGYGLGYYDKLLTPSPGAQTCGVGFKEQSFEEVPAVEGDIALKQILLF